MVTRRTVRHTLYDFPRVYLPALILTGLLTLTLFFAPATHAASCGWLGGSGNWDDATKWSCGAAPSAGDSATIDSYGNTVTLTSAVNLGSLTLKNGTLDGNYNLTITGGLNWDGGTIKGPGQLYLTATSVSIFTGQHYLDGRVINNAGTVNANDLQLLSNGAAWNNQAGGTLDFQGDSVWQGNQGANSILTNEGTVKKSAGNATLYLGKGPSGVVVALNNKSTVEVQSGTLQIDGGGSSTGPITVGTNATLRLAGSFDFNGGGDIIGTGSVLFDPGPTRTVNLSSKYSIGGKTAIASGTLNITGSAVVEFIGNPLEIKNSGMLATAVPIQIYSAMIWTGGTIKGPGSLTIGAGAALTLSNSLTLDSAILNNNGIATTSGTLAFYMNNGAVWNNATNALLDVQGDGMIVGDLGLDSTLNNSGTIRKSAGTNTLRLGNAGYSAQMALNNTGLIQAQKGRLYITGPFTQFSGTTLSGGSYEVSAILAFNNANIVTNSAKITLDGAMAQVQGALSSDNGLANFANNSASGQLILRNGKNLSVPNVFTNAGSVTIEGSSSFAVASGNYVQSAGTTKLSNGALNPAGLVNITGGELGGIGTVNSSVINAGNVSPGNPTGTLTVTGQYQQTSTGALNVELAGTGAGQYDQLNVAAAAALDGTLNVSRLNGFAPVTGDTFQIITHGAGSGTFATSNGLNLGNNLALGVQYNPDNVKLATGPAGLTLSSLNPEGALAGSADFVLTVNGTGFVSGAQVKWNGSARTTTFVNSTQLTAQIVAADIHTAGTATVTVSIPGGLTSDGLAFVIKAVAVPTTAVLQSSSPTTYFGQSVTLSLDVTPGLPGGPAPTGTVTFYEVMGTATQTRRAMTRAIVSPTSTSFTFTTAALAPGVHTIGAAYSGDSNYSASIAVPIKQTVNKALTTTDLTSSAPATYFGEPVTFTATVKITAPGGGILTGNVAFMSDSAPVAGCESRPISAGVASCTIASLAVGYHVIQGFFIEGAQYAASNGKLYPDHQVKPFTPIRITGMVYHDSNLNGSKQLIENPIGGVKVQLINLATGVISTTTTSSLPLGMGTFAFKAGWGIYRVRLVPAGGWYQTSPNPADFTSQSGVNVGGIYIGEVKGADLSITMTPSVSTAAPGTTIAYTIKVYNPGPFLAPLLTMQFNVPANTQYVSLSGPFGSSCGGTVFGPQCTMAGLGANGTALFTAKVKVKAGTPTGTLLTAVAKASSAFYDPDKTNNQVSTLVTVQ